MIKRPERLAGEWPGDVSVGLFYGACLVSQKISQSKPAFRLPVD